MATLFEISLVQATDGNGDVAPGALMYFYNTGTSDKISVYADASALTLLTNPVVANSQGRFAPCYVAAPESTRVRQTTASGEVIFDTDQIEEEEVPAYPGPIFYVSTGGSGSNPGTIASPWTLAKAVASATTSVTEDVTVLLRGSTDPAAPTAYTVANENGVVCERGGSVGRPVNYVVYPGEYAEIDARIQGLTWTLNRTVAGRPIYRSNQVVRTAGVAYPIGANIKIGTKWVALIALDADSTAQMDATTDEYRTDGAYYPGPCIMRRTSDGYLEVCLSPCSSTAMLGRTVNWPATTNPNSENIAVSADGLGVKFGASHLRWNVPVVNAYTLFGWNATPVSHITLGHAYDRPLYQAANKGGLNNLGYGMDSYTGLPLAVRPVSDGGLPFEGHWLHYADVKGGQTIAEPTRRRWMAMGDAAGSSSASANTLLLPASLTGYFDGGTGDACLNDTFGYQAATDDLSAALAPRCTDIWDDLFQPYSGWQGFVCQWVISSTGIGWDGSSSSTAKGSSYPRERNCMYYPTKTLPYGRKGTVDADTGENLEGQRYPQAISSHGIRNGGTDYTFPRKSANCLYVHRAPNVMGGKTGYVGDLSIATSAAGNHEGGNNIHSNNLHIADGNWVLLWMSRDYYPENGRDIFTGNARVRFSGTNFPSAASVTSGDDYVFRFVHRSGSTISPKTWAAIKADAVAYAATKTNYPPGIADVENEILSTNLDAVVSAVNYRPQLALLKTGGPDLSLLLADGRPYQEWFGARAGL